MIAHQPILFIGIGSSGLYTLEQLQNFCYENTGRNKPPYAEYLYIETNKDNRPGITAVENEIKRVYISLSDMKVMIQELKQQFRETVSWLPPEDHILEAGMGAGGIPAVGRLALWGKNTDGNNIVKVMDAIRSMHQRVSGHGALGSDSTRQPAVFITGSLTGGTGSGIFVDLAYLVRMLIPGIQDVYSLLLLPPEPDIMQGNEIIYANSYGALKALAHYNKGEEVYVIPNNPNRKFKEPPFELAQFICQSYNDGTPRLHTLGGLYKMSGLFLFLNMMGLRAKRRERLVDASGNMQIGKYGTFGLSAIQYPKAQIQEYLSLDLGINLLDRWIDPQNYYQADTRLKIDNYKITREVNQEFGNILRGAFDRMNAAGGYNILEEVRKEVASINKKEKQNPRGYLYDLFSPNVGESFYHFLSNRIQVGFDYVIVSISQMIIETFNKYESLYYTRMQLLAITEAIKETLDYWRSIGIAQNAPGWESTLPPKINWMTRNSYKFILEENNVLQDRMLTVIEQLKMHLFFDRMIALGKNIQKEETPLSTGTLAEKVELPILSRIDSTIREIQVTIGKRDDEKEANNFKSLRKRMLEIEADMEDKTIPIRRIFPSGGFDKEVRLSKDNYKNETGKTFPSKDTILKDGDLWAYLNDSSGIPLRRKLYHDCILKFREELDRFDSVRNFDVSEYVQKNLGDAIQYAGKSVSYLLPIREKILDRAVNIPKVVIGSDKEVITSVIRLLRKENFNEFEEKGDHILEIQELKNIMVFYIEQGNYKPLEDLHYIPEVEKVDREYPVRHSEMTEEKWFVFRNPYIERPKAKKMVAEAQSKDTSKGVAEESKEKKSPFE